MNFSRRTVLCAVGGSVCLLFSGVLPTFAQSADKKPLARRIQYGMVLKSLTFEGKEYRYAVYVPPQYDGSEAFPLITFLHGSGECGTDGLKSAIVGIGSAAMLKSEEWRTLILIPQKPETRQHWEELDKVILAMTEETEKRFKVDKDRLYLTGLSQGGYGSWALAAKYPAYWAAVAPICGGGDPKDAAILAKIPIWAFHGEADDSVPVERSREMIAAIKAAGGSPKLTTYPGVGHNSWDKAYRDENLFAWFLEHKKQRVEGKK